MKSAAMPLLYVLAVVVGSVTMIQTLGLADLRELLVPNPLGPPFVLRVDSAPAVEDRAQRIAWHLREDLEASKIAVERVATASSRMTLALARENDVAAAEELV